MKRYMINTRVGTLRARLFSTTPTQAPAYFVLEDNRDEKNFILGGERKFFCPGNVTPAHLFFLKEHESVDPKPRAMENASTSIQTILKNDDQRFIDRDFWQKQMEQAALENTDDVPVEIRAQKCPRLLRRDLKTLFPQMDLREAKVNVVNISQHSSTDQSAWSSEMEVERDKLTSNFVNTATTICSALEKSGYWADFIDPSSGRPFSSRYTNATLFETNEAYQSLGFQIEDLGCCKVLKHQKWGTHAFVGTIFTDAPIDSPVMQQLLDTQNASDKIE